MALICEIVWVNFLVDLHKQQINWSIGLYGEKIQLSLYSEYILNIS